MQPGIPPVSTATPTNFGVACRLSIFLSLAAVLGGCASDSPAPSNPKQDNARAALAGMLLMSSATQDGDSPASKSLEVNISTAALEVINKIEGYRRKFGKWPTRAEITAPSGVENIGITDLGADLEVIIKSEGALPLRCRIQQDGTIVVVPPFFQAATRTNQIERTRP